MKSVASELERLSQAAEGVPVSPNRPLKVSVFGQTGVGKSSLLNVLFEANLETDAVRPCTSHPQRVKVVGPFERELWFYDLPGIGEAGPDASRHLSLYREFLLDSDVALWAIHADSRSVSQDVHAINWIFSGLDGSKRSVLMSKITFVLTKADLLTSAPWILAKRGEMGAFAPLPQTTWLLTEKERYLQDVLIRPFGRYITSRTFNREGFNISDDRFSFDDLTVQVQGLFDLAELSELKKRHPRFAPVFERLYDNFRIIPCSAAFRYNLDQLVIVLLNKLRTEATERFDSFINRETLTSLPIDQATALRNFVLFDPSTGRVVWDMNDTRLLGGLHGSEKKRRFWHR